MLGVQGCVTGVNLVRTNAVPVEVADRLDWVGLAINLDFVALHHLLRVVRVEG